MARRLPSIDAVRGIVMALMAVDHVRVYAGVPAGGPTFGVFFTRWVTHFCAPAFVFLAGTAAFLHGEKLGDRGALGRWLAVRGLLLVVLELTWMRVAWTFNLELGRYLMAGVLWMLGWCMVLLALLVRLPVTAVGALGVAVMATHNLTAFLEPESVRRLLAGPWGGLWKVLYFGGGLGLGSGTTPGFFVLYSIVPWIGVMAAGYAFGLVVVREPAARRRACLALGLAATALFVLLRLADVYGDRPWSRAEAPALIAFLNTTKYPASLAFLLMTLGPTLVALALLEGREGVPWRWLAVFGRVPGFFYLVHIPLIHGAAVAISLVRSPAATGWLFQDHPLRPGPVPDGYVWSLGLLYLVTGLVVVALYLPCRWFARLKARRREAWLSYI
ncbi:MAG TPA: heparan-alpha-glucosaminide N-acetyltransferase domain-containing protein [Vicinamibacteria bacterium]